MAILIRHVVNNSPSIKRIHGQYVGLQNEHVELMNTSNEDVDLDGWTIEDVKKNKQIFDISNISKVRKIIRSGKISKKQIWQKLKEIGITKQQLDALLRIIKSRKISDNELLPLPKFNQLPKTLPKLYNLLETDIRRDIKTYAKPQGKRHTARR